ncbi:MAG: Gmad2 immunoglobulin-like domain-containing protein [Patescibacteria group bacterium]|jgi:hypothetical protein
MKKSQFLLAVVILILLSAGFLRLTGWGKIVVKNETIVAPKPAVSISSTSEVIVTNPVVDEIIKSPLTVNGQAKGNWFFEASLPVKLVTVDNEVIAAVPGQAQRDWMTAEFVPFIATLDFTTKATRGYLIIAKDNPSGLPQNDASITIPIKFK